MRYIFAILFVLVGVSANAAEIRGGRFDKKKNAIVLDIAYVGGHTDHTFSLGPVGCFNRLFGIECIGALIEDSNQDQGGATIVDEITLTLEEVGLTGEEFKGAALFIHGDKGSGVNINLPRAQAACFSFFYP